MEIDSGEVSDKSNEIENIVSDDDSRLLSDKDDGELAEPILTEAVPKLGKAAGGDDELDFEVEDEVEEGEEKSDDESTTVKKEVTEKDDDEEGEVNTDDDLEEGEVKEDDDEEEGAKKSTEQKPQKNICRFFGAGKCTWGDACRFSHELPDDQRPVKPSGNQSQRNFSRNQPLIRMPPQPADNYAPYPSGRGPLLPLPPHPPAAPLLPLPNPSESSWERGVRSAKRMVAEASKRKEQDVDFDEKRVNQGLDDEPPYYAQRHGHHSRTPSPRRGHDRRSTSPYYRDYPPPPPPPAPSHRRDQHREYDSEYERRHRLAFQSAPDWPNEPASGRRPADRRFERAPGGPESFRDPWRRSPNSPGRRPGRGPDREAGFPPCGDGGNSMSSISGSDSASDLSGSSDLSDSSSGSFSDNSAKKKKQPLTKSINRPHRQPPKDVLPGGTRPDVSRLPRIPKLNRPRDQPDLNKHKHGSDSGGKGERKREKRDDYDSWNDTDSSASGSGSDEEHRSRRHYRTQNEKSELKSAKRPSQEPSKAETLGKRPRKSTESGRAAASQSPHSAQSSPSARNATSPDRGSPHKKQDSNHGFSMKFNKKVNMLQKSSVSARLNGQRSESGEENSNDAPSGPSSLKENEDSMSPASRDLQAAINLHGGDMNKLLAKADAAEVSSTTSSKREVLLKQLRDIEAAIARKKKTTN